MKEQVQNGQTLLNICQQMSQQLDQMALIIQTLTGKDMGIGQRSPPAAASEARRQAAPSSEKDSLASGIMEAQHPMTGYGERLAKRSTPAWATNDGRRRVMTQVYAERDGQRCILLPRATPPAAWRRARRCPASFTPWPDM